MSTSPSTSDSAPTTSSTRTTSTTSTTSTSSPASTAEPDPTTGSQATTGPEEADLLLWLDFGEDPIAISGAIDKSPFSATAACVANLCPASVPGAIGSGVWFDGIDDHLSLPDAPRLRFDGPTTVAVWVYLESATVEFGELLFGKGFGSESLNSYEIYTAGTEGQVRWKLTDELDMNQIAEAMVPLDRWAHFAGTWDGAILAVYLDGEFVESVVGPASVPYDDAPVTLGADVNGDMLVRYFTGGLDELRVYARVLSEDEIRALATR